MQTHCVLYCDSCLCSWWWRGNSAETESEKLSEIKTYSVSSILLFTGWLVHDWESNVLIHHFQAHLTRITPMCYQICWARSWNVIIVWYIVERVRGSLKTKSTRRCIILLYHLCRKSLQEGCFGQSWNNWEKNEAVPSPKCNSWYQPPLLSKIL